jgi:hypothetical protein
MVCRQCGGSGVICSRVNDTVMRCPEPCYEDEDDLLGVCRHLMPCPRCLHETRPEPEKKCNRQNSLKS